VADAVDADHATREAVETDELGAGHRNGVLTVTMPKIDCSAGDTSIEID
jgi:HSP20 family molecular chaperone IbpA